MRRHLLAIVAVLLLISTWASAQTGPLSVQVGGGGALPLGDARAGVGAGWNVSVGATLRISGSLGVRADYLYGRFAPDETSVWYSLPSSPLTVVYQTTISGRQQMHIGSFDLVYTPRVRGRRWTMYILGGPSLVHRRATMTGTVQGNIVGFCRPQWFQCAAGPVPFDQAVGVREANGVGVNVGGGITLDVGLSARLFVEGRYTFVQGPEFTGPAGRVGSGARYLPFTVGLRF